VVIDPEDAVNAALVDEPELEVDCELAFELELDPESGSFSPRPASDALPDAESCFAADEAS